MTKYSRCYLTIGCLFASMPLGLLGASGGAAVGQSWPTFQQNVQRNAFVAAEIDAIHLTQLWEFSSPEPPQPAWYGPAKWDAYANLRGLHSMRNYDPVFHVTAVGGDVYFGSSSDHSVKCLDAETGEARWTFFVDGPVRIPPTHSDGKLYFGADDGYAYCLRAESGKLVWKSRPTDPGRLIVNNGNFIPLWPVRSGVVVEEGTAYFAASLLPWRESYLCAVDAATGKVNGRGRYVRQYEGLTLEGPLAMSSDLLIAPQGRVEPMLFSRVGGKQVGKLEGGGGAFVVVAGSQVLHGPGNKAGWLTESNPQTREKVATHKNARAVLVADGVFYFLTDTSLIAIEQDSGALQWNATCDAPLSLIAVGPALFVGGVERVTAFARDDGSRLCELPVDGRAYGLAFAGGRLLVSTDTGSIYAFAPSGEATLAPVAVSSSGDTPAAEDKADEVPLAKIEPVDDPSLVGRWVFQRPLLEGDQIRPLAGTRPATLDGPVNLERLGPFEALVLDGALSVTIADDSRDAKLPSQDISAEAWVRIDEPLTWGGIVGAIQDDGSVEHGWLLGYRGSKFCFGVAAEQGAANLTYLTDEADFSLGAWHHVAGTYDGTTVRLYVDGRLAASSGAQQGPIDYPDTAFYEIGAYHDVDENFPMTGMVHEVRVYERALAASQVADHHRAKAGDFPAPVSPTPDTSPGRPGSALVDAGPWLQFTSPSEAVIRWQTARPMPSVLEVRLDQGPRRLGDEAPNREHEVRLSDLKRNRIYHYQIGLEHEGGTVWTADYECDTFFNYARARITNGDRNSEGVSTLLEQAGVTQGLALVFGDDDGQLALELARQSDMRVIAVSNKQAGANAARQRLHQAGVYGTRVAVRLLGDGEWLTPHCANLVAVQRGSSRGRLAISRKEAARLVAPGGQVAFRKSADRSTNGETTSRTAWQVFEAPAIPGSGEWTHAYGRADNSAYGGEALAGANSSDDLVVQWIGRPGPRYQADRSGRKPPPLSSAGRLFMQGLHRIVAADAYNGTILWALETPHFERFNVPRDCSNWCADQDAVYAAVRDRLWRIAAPTGQVEKIYQIPGPSTTARAFDWGYVAAPGDVVLGTAAKRGASVTNFFGGDGWYDGEGGPATQKVCSDTLFALDRDSGDPLWEHAGGVIINSTITISDDRIYFVESRNPKVRSDASRRIGSAELWKDQSLVALDVGTGNVAWEVPLDTVDGKVIFYLAHGAGRLVIVSSADKEYHVYAVDPSNGAPLWDARFPWAAGGKADHGSHLSRPAIVGNKLFVRPRVLDITNGELREEQIPEGKCGTYACSQFALFYRGHPGARSAVWSMADGEYSLWNRLRPDCWLSTIPAGGLLLSPEGGGGCSCGSWLETSLAFIPKVHADP